MKSAEARRRLAEFGPNAVTEVAPPRWRTFLGKLWGPVPWMLELALVLQISIGAYVEAAVLGALLVFNATLGIIQEGRAGAALALLRQRLAPTALALRDGRWQRLPASELVPGDLIRLALGALVPADARIASGSLLVDQSTITGESVPAEANPGSAVYAGSLVRRGEADAQVTATGSKTYFGRAAELVRVARSASTEQAAIFAVTRNLALVNGTVALLLVAYGYATGLPAADLVRLALTALLATIPAALPATFTLSAALGAQILAKRGVLLTRLSAAHEAAAMNVLCADKTGTLTRNDLEVAETVAMTGFKRERTLALAAWASSETSQDPIDGAIRKAAAAPAPAPSRERLLRFVPFDPETRLSEAWVATDDGSTLHIVKGAFPVVAGLADSPPDTEQRVNDLGARGSRVIAVAAGPSGKLRLVGLIALSDPPRDDSKPLVDELRQLGVRTLMITGDSATTAAAIARQTGIEEQDVFARVLPEEKFRIVERLQREGRVVGMCGDGTNDAPALRQAQIGIAVSTATDVAKAAAGMVLTEPGLGGIVFAVREGRIAFQRLATYAFNMLVKKVEIVSFLAIGLAMTGHAVMTPVLMVLMLVTNDFLAMSLTTDRATPQSSPGHWRMSRVTAAALLLGVFKLAFSTAVLAYGKFSLTLSAPELQTLALVTLVFGAQGLLYVVREHGSLWSSKPSSWVIGASLLDVAIISSLALSGTLMAPLPWSVLMTVLVAAAALAFVLDQVKLRVLPAFIFRTSTRT
ncbi:MAG TPA: HAD-IC family P-type ATPase [Burkholderiales bacterium]|nr:HAD-IC family P-type ATPase [Burkholderiales bacterium]